MLFLNSRAFTESFFLSEKLRLEIPHLFCYFSSKDKFDNTCIKHLGGKNIIDEYFTVK